MASRLPRLAWGALFFNLASILWGALVRATGSGAGCGSHWPLCNGEIIPNTHRIATAIEFTHRLSSGVCLVLAVLIAWRGWRDYPRKSPVRKASAAVLGFTLSEALLGAVLVLYRYVEHDQSVGRAVSISLHLSNTFLLLASLALTAWFATFAPEYRLQPAQLREKRIYRLSVASIAAAMLLGMTGALTALGDTLFRTTTLAGGFSQDFAPSSHFLLKLRVLHPVLALLTGALVFYFAEVVSEQAESLGREGSRAARLALWLKALVAGQLIAGFVNFLLLAPMALQLVHLFVADALWVVLVLTVTVSLQAPAAVRFRAPTKVRAGA